MKQCFEAQQCGPHHPVTWHKCIALVAYGRAQLVSVLTFFFGLSAADKDFLLPFAGGWDFGAGGASRD